MTKRSKANVALSNKKQLSRYKFWLTAIPVIALIVKFVVMANTEVGGWLGADGENYLTGVDGLLKDGFFSTEGKLIYWPAGYPIFVWPFAKLSLTHFIYYISFVQSILFAFATYIFTKSLSQTKVSNIAIWVSFLISFNPTLSLSSLAIGYESPISSLLMITSAYILKDLLLGKTNHSSLFLVITSLCLSIAVFFQPRIILFAFSVGLIWALSKENRLVKLKISTILLVLVMLFPSLLVFRNIVANGQATISTNLGVTMRIGAGDKATGGYGAPDGSIPCPPAIAGQAVTDNQIVICVLKWYQENPKKALKLMVSKSRYYWSPWFGPEANGTMARNPWLKISPLIGFTKNKEGFDLVYGPVGKLVSLMWMIGGMLLIALGFRKLWSLGGLERQLSWLIGTPVLLGWLISLGTIGDHRFRIPQMGLSLALQVLGVMLIHERVTRRG